MRNRLLDRWLERVPLTPWIYMTLRQWGRAWLTPFAHDDP